MIRLFSAAVAVSIALSSMLPPSMLSPSSNAQELGGESYRPELPLPQDPRAWLNSAPISTEAMRGKAIVLYFFEEGCPRCRERWPSILAAAKQYSDKPVMLIAVNSGTSADLVARYVRDQRISLPVIVDYDRSIERAAGVNEISLNNIWQARIIDPSGQIQRADGGDIAATLEAAGAEARWNVDPSEMPPEVLPTWRLVEFGSYAAAAKMVARFARDRKPNLKSAGERLQAYVQQKMDDAVAAAKSSSSAGDDWKAFQIYESIRSNFAGFELPASVESEWTRLKDKESIATELDALKLWETAQKIVASGRATPARVAAMMDKIIERYPGTEAATMAANVPR